MKAAVLEAKQVMNCRELTRPAPASDEVLVRVAYCGVCGSDVPRFLDGAVHFFPLVLGHEFSGTVVEVGEDVDAGLLGKRVAGVPLVPCMSCPDCEDGNYSLCRNYSFIGSRRNGAYAEFVAVPAKNVLPVSDGVSDMEAAFFEPASVAQHAVELASPEPPAQVAVCGCGTIGIFLAQILQARGFEVTAFARRESRLNAARAAGVEHMVNTTEPGWDDAARGALPRGGYDYVFDTSGNGAMMVKSFDLAANKGTVCMVGTPKRPMEFTVAEWENLNRKELVVTGAWMSYSAPWPGREWEAVADQFSSGILRVVDEMIDSVYDLEHISGGMKKFAIPNSVTGKLLIKCQ